MAQLVGSNSLGLGKLIDGKNQFVHIMYSANADGSNMTTEIQSDTKYIGIVTSSSETAPANPSDYSWGRFVGTSGTSSYTWLRYSPNEDGSNMTVNPTPETKYIGVAITADNNAPTDYTKYSWALIKGDDGRGISKTEVTYQKSTSGTVIPTGTWVTTIPTVNAGEYLWTRTLFTYTDNTTSSTYSVARSGVTGLGISRSDVDYQKSTSGTVAPTGAWTATIPTVAANEYLWTRTILTYTNATTSVSYSVGKMGADGKDAKLLYLTASSQVQAFDKDNKPKTSQAITISAKLQNASGTATFVAIPYIGNIAQTAITLGGTGNNRTLLPSQWTNTQWTTIAITATLGSLTDTISVVRVKDGDTGATGKDGVAGKDGVGLKSTTIQYAQSTSGTTAPTTGWATNVPTLVKGQYLWTKTVWTYTDNTTETGYSVAYMGTNGNNGTNGIAGKDGVGIKSTAVTYAKSTSGTTAPTTGWASTVPSVPAGQFLWTRSIWTYTDNTTETGYSVAMMGVKGDKGNTGDKGVAGAPGADGRTPYLHTAYAWSEDGTDRFTTVYPGENYAKNSKRTLELSNVTNNRNQVNGDVPYNLADLAGKTVTISVEIEVKNSQPQTSGGSFRIGCEANMPRTNGGTFYLGVWENLSAGQTIATKRISRTLSIPNDIVAERAEGLHLYAQANGDYFRVSKTKIEIGDTPTIYTPAPLEDYANAYPTYTGTYTDYTEADSTNPADYTWVRILGQTPVVHQAWSWSPDGTDRFTTVYPGENLIIANSEAPIIRPFQGSTVTSIPNITVPEWNATNAVEYTIGGGTSTVIGITGVLPTTLAKNSAYYSHSIYVKNTGTVNVIVDNNLAQNTVIAPGEAKRVELTAKTAESTKQVLQFVFKVPNASDTASFIVWRAKIEENTTPTIYTPAPSEHYANAYPLYEGTYTDYSETASQNPADYTWVRILGQTPVVHQAWSWSPDGTDRFTTVYPGENLLALGYTFDTKYRVSKIDRYFMDIKTGIPIEASTVYAFQWDFEHISGNDSEAVTIGYANENGYFMQDGVTVQITDKKAVFKTLSTIPNDRKYLGLRLNRSQTITSSVYDYTYMKIEKLAGISDAPTLYTPAPSEDYANAYPLYEGTYTDYSETASINPADYTWRRIIGESGQDGVAGADGKGIKSTAVTYQASTSGTVAPTGTWVVNPPTVAKGQYLWTRTIWTYTDDTTETGYSVAYMGTNGNNGTNGIAGKDGVGIKSTDITYAVSSSGTTAPASGWIANPPAATAGQFMWTKTVWTYTDNTKETGYSVGKIGEKGDTGPRGPQGPAGPKGDQGIRGVAYLQPTQPSTTQEGAQWFKTVSTTDKKVTAIYTYTGGAWVQTPLTATALNVTSLSSLTANLGTVTAGTINGVTITGSTINGAFINSGRFMSDYEIAASDNPSGMPVTGTMILDGGAYRNTYQYDTGSTNYAGGLFFIEQNGTIYHRTNVSGSHSDSYTLTPTALAMESGYYEGALTAQQLTNVPWTNLKYASGYTTAEGAPVQYRLIYLLDGTKELQLRGRVKKTDGSQMPTNISFPIGTLPTGYRVSTTEIFPAADDSRKGGRVALLTTGIIQVDAVFGSKYVSFGGIRAQIK